MAHAPTTVPDLEKEPALAVGELFADKAKTKLLVTAVISVLVALGVNVAPGLDEQIVTILNTLVPLVLTVLGYQAMTVQAREQALDTRGLVYAPSTVERIAERQYDAGTPPTEPQPPVPAPPGGDDVDAINRG
jgi:hypothetical protein